jgi:hypothetical protein
LASSPLLVPRHWIARIGVASVLVVSDYLR